MNSRLNLRHLVANRMPLPQDAVGPLTSLVVSLINLQSPPSRDYPKRYYSALFRELPARELYPDYYIFIKEPRSLNGIMVSASNELQNRAERETAGRWSRGAVRGRGAVARVAELFKQFCRALAAARRGG